MTISAIRLGKADLAVANPDFACSDTEHGSIEQRVRNRFLQVRRGFLRGGLVGSSSAMILHRYLGADIVKKVLPRDLPRHFTAYKM